MSEVRWTLEQGMAIGEKGENILVAAAAGSGKTAVLVERIIQKIINDKIDIDKILVVTFTNAAAAEMRERILEAIYKKLDDNPEDEHLQKQIVLLGKSNISTIHSFCLDVIKNNFYEINVSPNFRIGDTAEIDLIKQEAIEEVFEKLYEEENHDFIKLLDTYEGYRNDDNLKSMILKIYNYIQSNPFPEKWLNEKVEEFNLPEDTEIAVTTWGKIIINEFVENIEDGIKKLEHIAHKLKLLPDADKFYTAIQTDINEYNSIIQSTGNWNILMQKAHSIDLSKWPTNKKFTLEIKDAAKDIKNEVKKKFVKDRDSYLIFNSEQIKTDIKYMYNLLNTIRKIIIEFSELFETKKREKNIIDFNNIEHFALQILVQQNEEGDFVQTETAKKYMEKFEEIAIDEYQDSNMVQEQILTAISNGKNMFMVGDVKQSIYKFRQARPDLFLGKYEKYKLKEDIKKGDDLKIQLFRNFRSRKNVLDLTNTVFKNIMSKELGEIDYTENEYLTQEKDYDEPENENINYGGKAELHIIDMAKEESTDENEEEEDLHLEKAEIEAMFVVNKIKELMSSDYNIYDKKQKKYRKLKYKDIVILLRATSAVAPIYEKALIENEIPVFSDTGTEYLDSIEIQTIMSVLKIIDNPLQDIPLVAVMRSMIGGFTDNDLIQIRLYKKTGYFYEAIEEAKNQEKDTELKTKIEKFLDQIESWREKAEYLNIDELIWNIYIETGYYNYVNLMPDGDVRVANLKMLFERAKNFETATFKGLFNFINFIDKLKLNSGDMGAAKLIGENENVVRIMSIHKSKGLEFPVVFLCDSAKQFNLRDLNDSIILHQEIGLGPKYINSDKKIEYNTIAKEAIKISSKVEAISEEMRVLYVALTRAREKLIITGVEKDYAKSIADKQKKLEMYDKLEPTLIKQSKSYLAWLELVNLYDDTEMKELLEIYTYKAKDITKKATQEDKKEEISIKDWLPELGEIDEKINQLLSWKYPNLFATTLESKTSVTKIKEIQNGKTKQEIILPKPKFLNKTEKLTSAEKGTLVHLCLQKMNVAIHNTKEKIQELIQELVERKIITQNEADQINIDLLYKFSQSELAKDILNAKKVYKEAPFYISLPAKEIYNVKTEEQILVQGIIDLYFEDAKGKITLVDYKTDYAKDENELIEKYKAQLQLYKRAIEQATGKPVENVYIYSTYLNKKLDIKFFK